MHKWEIYPYFQFPVANFCKDSEIKRMIFQVLIVCPCFNYSVISFYTLNTHQQNHLSIFKAKSLRPSVKHENIFDDSSWACLF